MNSTPARTRGTRGTSLIEILVVIVVLLVGILAAAQVFPGGFRILVQSRSETIAQQLDRTLLETASGEPDGLPEQILPVDYVPQAGVLLVVATPGRQSGDLSSLGNSVDANGLMSEGLTPIGYWPLVSGPNIMRRIVGEGHRIPAPRSVGTDFGSFLMLNFGPLLSSVDMATGLSYKPLFEIYGADMVEEDGAPTSGTIPSDEFDLDQPDSALATLYLPRTAAVYDGPGSGPGPNFPPGPDDRIYRISMTAWVETVATTIVRRDTTAYFTVYADPAGDFQKVALDSVLPADKQYDDKGQLLATGALVNLAPGESLLSVEPESIRIARRFIDVTAAGFTMDPITNRPNHPFEYKILDANLGQILFSPAGYNYYEPRPQGRSPLVARVSYDVYDWRIIHDDFRIPDSLPLQYKLTLSSLRSISNLGSDGKRFPGLNVPLALSAGGVVSHNNNRDFALIDVDTGATYMPYEAGLGSGYTVDHTTGEVTFHNAAADLSNGLQVPVIYPNDTSAKMINASGRNVRALYMANFDWSVQLLKASAYYLQTYSQPGAGQYYVGGSGPLGGAVRRLYFPWADLNQVVKIADVRYLDGANQLHSLQDQSFLVGAKPADPLGLPYIDVTQLAPGAVKFDNAVDDPQGYYGYAVKGVKGASVSARALWNPKSFSLTSDTAANMGELDNYRSNYRRTYLETSVQRGNGL